MKAWSLLFLAIAGCGTRIVELTLPPDAGDDAVTPSPPACQVVPNADARCLVCSTIGGTYDACLECQRPVRTNAQGDFCRVCSWNDQPGNCLQCFTAVGQPTQDDCDALRVELRHGGPGGAFLISGGRED
jgi:hypothetical protein